MIIQTSTSNVFRTAVHAEFPQGRVRRNYFDWTGGLALWTNIGKAVMVILPVVLALNLWMGSAITRLESQEQAIRAEVSTLEAININNRTDKAILLSPEYMNVVAAEKLALLPPSNGQIKRM